MVTRYDVKVLGGEAIQAKMHVFQLNCFNHKARLVDKMKQNTYLCVI